MRKPEKKIKAAKPLTKQVAVIAEFKEIKPSKKEEAKVLEAIAEIRGLLKTGRVQAFKLAETMFLLGCTMKPFVGKGSEVYGAGIVEDIAKAVEYSARWLYSLHDLAKRHDYSMDHFREFVVSLEREGKKDVSLTYLTKEARKTLGPVHDPKHRAEQKQELINKVEQGAEAVKELGEEFTGDEEAMGATIMYAEELSAIGDEMLGDEGKSGLYFKERFNCPELRKFINQKLFCCITDAPNPDPHHLIYKSKGKIASDLSCVPLSREAHDEIGRIGRAAFEKKYKEKIPYGLGKVAMETIQAFISYILYDKLPF